MSVIALAHLRFFLPSAGGLPIKADVLVVILGIRVFDPEIAGGDPRVAQVGVMLGVSSVAPGSS